MTCKLILQVHKETVSHVPNAVAGRDNIEVEIFGMEGIPEADRIAHELHKIGKCSMLPQPFGFVVPALGMHGSGGLF